MVLFAGKTVWSMSEHYACILKWRFINTLPFLSFTSKTPSGATCKVVVNNSPMAFAPLCENMTSSTKPEVHNVVKRTESQATANTYRNFVKLGRVIFEAWVDRQTNKQTCRWQYFAPLPRQSKHANIGNTLTVSYSPKTRKSISTQPVLWDIFGKKTGYTEALPGYVA